jgi:hypothetical protein
MYSNAIRAAGYPTTNSDFYDAAGGEIQVAFGAHAVPPPPGCVVFNSEHHPHHFDSAYLSVLASARLVVNMGEFPLCPTPVVVPPGIVTTDLSSGPERDLDVLWYGSVTRRRAQMLESLSKAGVSVTALYGVLGPARDRFIDRAKVVLDLKQDGTEPDDQTRVFWSLSRGACTLSENAPASATDACKLTPETIVQRVRYALDVGAEGRRRLHSAYALALGPCDVSPMLRALGL